MRNTLSTKIGKIGMTVSYYDSIVYGYKLKYIAESVTLREIISTKIAD